jgi:hypothetical protein
MLSCRIAQSRAVRVLAFCGLWTLWSVISVAGAAEQAAEEPQRKRQRKLRMPSRRLGETA